MADQDGSAMEQRKTQHITFDQAEKFARDYGLGKTQREIASAHGLKQSSVSRAVQIFSLPEAALKWCEERGLTVFAAYELVKLNRKKPELLQVFIQKGGEGLAFIDGKPLAPHLINRMVAELLELKKPKQVRRRTASTYAPDPAKAEVRYEQSAALEEAIEELIHACSIRHAAIGIGSGVLQLWGQLAKLEGNFSYERVIEQTIRTIAKRWQGNASGVDPLRVFDLVFNFSSYQDKATTEGGARWVRLASRTTQICQECAEVKSMSSIYCSIPQKPDGEPGQPIYRCGVHLGIDKPFGASGNEQVITAPAGHRVMFGSGLSGVYHYVKESATETRCGLEVDRLVSQSKSGMALAACLVCKQMTVGSVLVAAAAVKHG